ncbi:MAG: type II toxin-antitoxin system RelE/ParE family toxin [Selenomonadaceae bacterium]|nr:type II toxin-antitoxin system RelE/ParE family toxin [Selenomonadaceae bacterium]MBQ9496316.1 type II toxin-antitoxin system RelE/ParE family toxin [Selenomonadaceae bacterium]
MGLTDDDLKNLQRILLENPKIGSVIRGTGRLRKMRYGYGNRGKSHCARVCYVDFEIHEKIFLVMVFAKNEMENLSQAERNSIKQLIERLEKYFEGSK